MKFVWKETGCENPSISFNHKKFCTKRDLIKKTRNTRWRNIHDNDRHHDKIYRFSDILQHRHRETSSNPFKYKVKATQIQKSTWRYLKTWIISFYLSYISLFVPLMPLFFTVHGLVHINTPKRAQNRESWLSYIVYSDT